MSRDAKHYTLSTITANGNSKAIDVRSFRHIVVSIGNTSATTTTATLKFQGALGDTAPAFGTPASTTNQWDYIGFADLNDKSTLIAGGTGIAFSGASDGVSMYEINTNGLDWICIETTGYSAGSIVPLLTCYDNG